MSPVGVKHQPKLAAEPATSALGRWLLTARCRLLPCRLGVEMTRLLMGHPRWCLDRRRERAKTACPVQGLEQTSPSRRSVRCRKRQQDVAPVEGLIHERPQRYLLVGAL